MPKRTSPKDIARIAFAADLDDVVVDKREGWRASDVKARRRQRRYKQLLTRELIKQPPGTDAALDDEDDQLFAAPD